MSVDLTRLTPAPWYAQGEGICCGLYGEPQHHLIFGDDGATWADTQFCALARNAFDIMTRRGWGVVERVGGWCVSVDPYPFVTAEGLVWMSIFPDPFTALIEADKWYKANVENVKEEKTL